MAEIGVTWIRLVVGAVFLMAGLSKLPSEARFVNTVRGFRILPRALTAPVAFALPMLEVGLAILLFVGVAIPLGASVAIILPIAFALASASARWRGITLDCDCFGLLYRERIGIQTIVRDLILASLAVSVILWDDGSVSLWRVLRGSPNGASIAMALVTVSVLAASSRAGWVAAGGFPLRRSAE